MAYAFNLDAFAEELDRRNFSLYDAIEEDDDLRREIDKALGFILPMYMSGAVSNAAHEEAILRFDEVCNPGWSKLRKHPKLQMMLLAAAGSGRKVHHKFFGGGTRKEFSKLHDVLRRRYPDLRKADVRIWAGKNSADDFDSLLRALGVQKDEAKELQKEFAALKKELG